MKSLLRLTLAALWALPLSLQAQQAQADWSVLERPRTLAPRPTSGPISARDLQTRLYRFADDSMGGRLLGSPGNVKGTDYIAAELKRLGLEPGGEDGTFFQTLPLVSRTLDPATMVMAGGRHFAAWDDFAPRDQGPAQRAFDGKPVIWGGDVSRADARITPEQAAGKVVLLVASQDIQGNPHGVPNRGQVITAYRDAAALFIVARENLSAQDISDYQVPAEQVLFGGDQELPAYAYISAPMAAAMMGRPIAGLAAGTAGGTAQGAILWRNDPAPNPARNVIGILRGSDPTLRNEFVAVGAHNDHVGTGTPVAHDSMYVVNHLFRAQGADQAPPRVTGDSAARVNAILARVRQATGGKSARPDSIFNGADDDGSGSMAVLEIAEQFASGAARPKRSMLFIWHVGEEEGLYGSRWFTDHPTVSRDAIVAELNIDMIGRGMAADATGQTLAGDIIHGNPDYVQLIGSRRLSTSLGNLAEAVNASGEHGLKFDYALDANGHPQNIYCRSDHYMYARYGIPIIFFTTGGHADYHQVTDEPQYIDYPHYARVTSYVADLARNVADLSQRPVVDQPKPDPNGACQQ